MQSEAPATPAAVFLRVPLADAERHRAELRAAQAGVMELGAARARICALEAELEQARAATRIVQATSAVTLEDIREVLLDEANEDSDIVRSCLEWNDNDETEVCVVDTIRELCGRVVQLDAAIQGALEERDVLAKMLHDLKKTVEQERRASRVGPADAETLAATVDDRLYVVTRRDAHGRRFLDVGNKWGPLDRAAHFQGKAMAEKSKPRGSAVWSLDGMAELLAGDVAAEAKKALKKAPMTSTPWDVTHSGPLDTRTPLEVAVDSELDGAR